MTRRSLSSLFALPAAFAIRARSQFAAADAYSTFDSDGTAHIKRAIPVPKTISPEARALIGLGRQMDAAGRHEGSGLLYGKDEGRLSGRCRGHDIRRGEGLGRHPEAPCGEEAGPRSHMPAWRWLHQRLGISHRKYSDGGQSPAQRWFRCYTGWRLNFPFRPR